MKRIIFLLITLFSIQLQSQIVVDNTAPYNTPNYLVNNILLGGGVTAINHTFQGEPSQIGWFNAINTPLGIDSGIVMACGDIYTLDPIVGSSFPFLPNTVTDPDLLAVANSVPGLIGQTFSVSSIGDVAVLEFDFIPTSDSMEFRYAFGSQEYFAWENSSFNDVFASHPNFVRRSTFRSFRGDPSGIELSNSRFPLNPTILHISSAVS